jgi:hypothetical protein
MDVMQSAEDVLCGYLPTGASRPERFGGIEAVAPCNAGSAEGLVGEHLNEATITRLWSSPECGNTLSHRDCRAKSPAHRLHLRTPGHRASRMAGLQRRGRARRRCRKFWRINGARSPKATETMPEQKQTTCLHEPPAWSKLKRKPHLRLTP